MLIVDFMEMIKLIYVLNLFSMLYIVFVFEKLVYFLVIFIIDE